MKAVELGNSIGFDERSLAWQVPEVHVGQPLVATANIGNAQSPAPPSCGERINSWESQAVGSTAWPAVAGEFAVLATLRVTDTDTSPIPQGIAMAMELKAQDNRNNIGDVLSAAPAFGGDSSSDMNVSWQEPPAGANAPPHVVAAEQQAAPAPPDAKPSPPVAEPENLRRCSKQHQHHPRRSLQHSLQHQLLHLHHPLQNQQKLRQSVM